MDADAEKALGDDVSPDNVKGLVPPLRGVFRFVAEFEPSIPVDVSVGIGDGWGDRIEVSEVIEVRELGDCVGLNAVPLFPTADGGRKILELDIVGLALGLDTVAMGVVGLCAVGDSTLELVVVGEPLELGVDLKSPELDFVVIEPSKLDVGVVKPLELDSVAIKPLGLDAVNVRALGLDVELDSVVIESPKLDAVVGMPLELSPVDVVALELAVELSSVATGLPGLAVVDVRALVVVAEPPPLNTVELKPLELDTVVIPPDPSVPLLELVVPPVDVDKVPVPPISTVKSEAVGSGTGIIVTRSGTT